jgi:lipopolysaccharide transport system permease protein
MRMPTTGRAIDAPFAAFLQHWSLTRELAKRDVLGRYRGANFGLLWSLITPLMMLAVYTIAFGWIMRSRWSTPDGIPSDFAPVLFLGIIVHGFFAEVVGRSPRLFQEHVNYVKRVVFPLHVLSWSIALAAVFHLATSMLIFVVLAGLVFDAVSPLVVLLPLVLMPLVLLTVAVSWFTASLGVYLRDIQQIVPVLTTAMFFLSSAIIPVEAVPASYRWVFELNPLTFFIDQARNVVLWGVVPDWYGLGIYLLASLALLYAAYGWLRATSRGFADVL